MVRTDDLTGVSSSELWRGWHFW